jgi:hypothetical protein
VQAIADCGGGRAARGEDQAGARRRLQAGRVGPDGFLHVHRARLHAADARLLLARAPVGDAERIEVSDEPLLRAAGPELCRRAADEFPPAAGRRRRRGAASRRSARLPRPLDQAHPRRRLPACWAAIVRSLRPAAGPAAIRCRRGGSERRRRVCRAAAAGRRWCRWRAAIGPTKGRSGRSSTR